MNTFDVTDELDYEPSLAELLVAQAQEVGRLEERLANLAEEAEKTREELKNMSGVVLRLRAENQDLREEDLTAAVAKETGWWAR